MPNEETDKNDSFYTPSTPEEELIRNESLRLASLSTVSSAGVEKCSKELIE